MGGIPQRGWLNELPSWKVGRVWLIAPASKADMGHTHQWFESTTFLHGAVD